MLQEQEKAKSIIDQIIEYATWLVFLSPTGSTAFNWVATAKFTKPDPPTVSNVAIILFNIFSPRTFVFCFIITKNPPTAATISGLWNDNWWNNLLNKKSPSPAGTENGL